MSTKTLHENLIKECLKGTERAFKALYNHYIGYVYTICVRHGISEIEIKDCTQTIFMEIFKSLNSFDPTKSQFKTWMTRIVINQILNHKRKKQIKYQEIDDGKHDLIESSFDIDIHSKLEEQQIHEILKEMPQKYITVFNLFIIDGYSHKEIAKQLSITESTSRVLLHRGRVWAMKELKQQLKESISVYKSAH